MSSPILVVDDNEANLPLAQQALTLWGYGRTPGYARTHRMAPCRALRPRERSPRKGAGVGVQRGGLQRSAEPQAAAARAGAERDMLVAQRGSLTGWA